jgi:cytochrome c oxidase subunit IV
MTDAHGSEHDHGPGIQSYLVVFGALTVFTAISFIVNATVGRNMTGLLIILSVAVCKAVLVGLYFMHLIVDWKRFYFLIFPTFILGAMFIVVLLPDIVIAWHFVPPAGTVAPSAVRVDTGN